jgi:hypothetical protein
MLVKQKGFKHFAEEFYEEFDISLEGLGTDALVHLMYDTDNDDSRDYFSDNVQITIEFVQQNTLFNFSNWVEWDSRNLHNALMHLNNGIYGTLPAIFSTNRTFFRA